MARIHFEIRISGLLKKVQISGGVLINENLAKFYECRKSGYVKD